MKHTFDQQPKMNQISEVEIEEYFIDFMAQMLVDQIIKENGEQNENEEQIEHSTKTLA